MRVSVFRSTRSGEATKDKMKTHTSRVLGISPDDTVLVSAQGYDGGTSKHLGQGGDDEEKTVSSLDLIDLIELVAACAMDHQTRQDMMLHGVHSLMLSEATMSFVGIRECHFVLRPRIGSHLIRNIVA